MRQLGPDCYNRRMLKPEMQLLARLAQPSDLRIVQIVLDGVGGLPGPQGFTELEAAKTPNLDALALRSNLGQVDPVLPGVTPGSGIAHLAVFGYDPLQYDVGRGAVAAAGVGLPLKTGSISARCNFVTLDKPRIITDRRAGRIDSAEGKRLVAKLAKAITSLSGYEVSVAHVMEYRFVVGFHGTGLSESVGDTDPQTTGVPPLTCAAQKPEAETTARLVDAFAAAVEKVLSDEPKANGVVMRGFASSPDLPSLSQLYGLRAQVIASYPDYRGVAALVGMQVQSIGGEGEALEEKVACYEQTQRDFDYTFLHIKKTDSYGEDKNFEAKVKAIETFDAILPRLLATQPDVLCITGDHCTPATMGAHSWHPVPLLIYGPHLRGESWIDFKRFTESCSARGALGRLPSERVMGLLLAQAGKLKKYGA